MQSLIIGGVLGCLGGFVFAVGFQSVQPDSYSTDLTFFAYAVLILGGAGRVFGPVLGAVVFWFLLVFIDGTLSQLVQNGTITFIRTDQVGQGPVLDPRPVVDAADDLSTTGNPRRQEGVGPRCPLTTPRR